MDLDLVVVGRDKAVHLTRCPQSFSPVLRLFFSFFGVHLCFFIMEGLRFRYKYPLFIVPFFFFAPFICIWIGLL